MLDPTKKHITRANAYLKKAERIPTTYLVVLNLSKRNRLLLRAIKELELAMEEVKKEVSYV